MLIIAKTLEKRKNIAFQRLQKCICISFTPEIYNYRVWESIWL